MDSGAIVAGLACLVNAKRAAVVTRLEMERPPMSADPRTGLMLAVRVAAGEPPAEQRCADLGGAHMGDAPEPRRQARGTRRLRMPERSRRADPWTW